MTMLESKDDVSKYRFCMDLEQEVDHRSLQLADIRFKNTNLIINSLNLKKQD